MGLRDGGGNETQPVCFGFFIYQMALSMQHKVMREN